MLSQVPKCEAPGAPTMNYATTSATQQYANNYGCWSYDSFGNRLLESISTTPCTGRVPGAGCPILPRHFAEGWDTKKPSALCR